ncbi:MAG TPA: hypothetical protein VJ001_12150 [Rhodocyclaceae bacterium]|nr:hypothetical protein [Rhodocyclaceae bacterium]
MFRSMKKARNYSTVLIALLAALFSPWGLAGEKEIDQRKPLLTQKLRLVETLIGSSAARALAAGNATPNGAEAVALVEKSRQALAAAKQALASNQADRAEQQLNEALKSIAAISARLNAGGGDMAESALRDSLRDLGEQVATYRASLEERLRDPSGGASAKELLARLDVLSAEAKRLETAGRLGEANKKLAEAYKLAVEGLSRLRAGQTVIMSLKFDTPADEYAYELRRFRSNEILVEMTIAERRAEGEVLRQVRESVGEGVKLKDGAATLAQSGDYAGAVTRMEKASLQLNRALQTLGVPVF